ncbi:MAG: hypothetical protein JNM11_11845 [Chitinimonas sp.]|nr:hypothetical protein [Chitinimonas sp.]
MKIHQPWLARLFALLLVGVALLAGYSLISTLWRMWQYDGDGRPEIAWRLALQASLLLLAALALYAMHRRAMRKSR